MFHIKGWWFRYQFAIERAVLKKDDFPLDNRIFWRKRLLSAFISYGFAASVIAFLSSITYGFFAGNSFIQWFNVGFACVFLLIVFNKKMMIHRRKLIALFLLYVLAIVYMAALGSEGPGVLYLLMITVFSAIILPRNMAYWLVALNALICSAFGVVIGFGFFDSPLKDTYDLPLWISYSGNLVFVSLISVMLINKVLKGLEVTIVNEANLVSKLDASEKYYRNTFEANPVPMYVFDLETGKFLQVNNAACAKYGYSREEFMEMNIMQIRPENEAGKLMDLHSMIKSRDYSGLLIHMDKQKHAFPVEIETNVIHYQDREARLVLATDVSERINYIHKIEQQNHDLMEIAWIQSHMVRAPLANIMSLTEFLINYPDEDTSETLRFLKDSSHKLNGAIKSIVGQAESSRIS
ncbi:PAS domain S-box protein [Pedobacter sp. AW31-3R]|uniref:PAS domain S-box protein n=1 Tax=Pedobacter sp. AW31-3R TaxID=3445781 RepID=UPI003F9F374F